MGNLGQALRDELNCESVFTIGGIGIYESVVVTWIIMAVVLLLSLILTRNLKVEHPGKRQLLLEQAVTSLEGITEGILGADGKRYAAYLTSVLMYLGIANLIGILGFKPPTKDLNVTAALAIMSIVLIEYAGIHQNADNPSAPQRARDTLQNQLHWLHRSMYLNSLSNRCHFACDCLVMYLVLLSLWN